MPRRFCTKSVEVIAVRLTEHNLEYVAGMCNGEVFYGEKTKEPAVVFPSPFGHNRVRIGDWIANDESGRFYPFSNEAFWDHHELIQPTNQEELL